MTENTNLELIRLNKYLAHAEIGDRRKCDEYIKQGLVSVNGTIISETGTKVLLTDIVKYRDQVVSPGKKVYILINKPKKFVIEETDGKNSLIHLVRSFSEKLKLGYTPKLFSLDILEESDLGLMLLTNDVELQKYYTSNKLNSVFKIEIDKIITEKDYYDLIDKFNLNDLTILDDEYLNLGIKTNSVNAKEIVDAFDFFGYSVITLDRTIIAGITKKDLPRGKWRFLKPKEVIGLKHLKH